MVKNPNFTNPAMGKTSSCWCVSMTGIIVFASANLYLSCCYLEFGRKSERQMNFEIERYPSSETASVSFTMDNKQDQQERRLHVLKAYCQRRNKPSQTQGKYLPFPHPDIVVSPRINLTVCQSSKAGSTFWRYFVKDVYSGSFIRDINTSFVSAAMSNDYTKVLLVRHPLRRMYSAYNDKVVRMTGHHFIMRGIRERFNDVVHHKFNDSCVNDFSYTDYIRLATKEVLSGTEIRDLHRMPHFKFCKPCEFHYDFVIKLETFISDSKELVSHLQKRGFQVVFDTKMFDTNFLFDKCRYFTSSLLAGWEFASHLCSTDERVLTGNLKGLHNQGYVSAFGFTKKAFQDLPVASWKDKCSELVSRVMKDPEKRKLASILAKEAAKRAIKSLPKIYLDAFIKAYLPDFEMFDYKTGF